MSRSKMKMKMKVMRMRPEERRPVERRPILMILSDFGRSGRNGSWETDDVAPTSRF